MVIPTLTVGFRRARRIYTNHSFFVLSLDKDRILGFGDIKETLAKDPGLLRASFKQSSKKISKDFCSGKASKALLIHSFICSTVSAKPKIMPRP